MNLIGVIGAGENISDLDELLDALKEPDCLQNETILPNGLLGCSKSYQMGRVDGLREGFMEGLKFMSEAPSVLYSERWAQKEADRRWPERK